MPTQDCMPSPDNARSLLGRLLDREVTVVLSRDSVEFRSAGPAVLALYEDDQKICRRAVVCDMPLAASLGAGLAMIPPRIAEEGARRTWRKTMQRSATLCPGCFGCPPGE